MNNTSYNALYLYRVEFHAVDCINTPTERPYRLRPALVPDVNLLSTSHKCGVSPVMVYSMVKGLKIIHPVWVVEKVMPNKNH